jgi:MYXO-CTERM domain-containing protein
MLRFRFSVSLSCLASALGAAALDVSVDTKEALACGGCFHPPPPPAEVDGTVVTDHRMAFSISQTQTVLWDQIRYSGSPSEFAWVLPVRTGSQIQLSQDAWLASLDASTQTIITGPVPPSCGGTAGTAPPPMQYENSGGGGGGCGSSFGGSSSDNAGFASAGDDGGASAGDDASVGTPQVQVVSQEVVGPYDAVTVRSSMGEALGDWLRANGYDVPTSLQPIIDAFTAEGFDFIALKLRPGAGVQAMQPVRIVTPGADPTLPLRMVAAGVGAHVGLELYVLGEGRYHTQNFPDASIDWSQLAWDPYTNISTYSTLAQQALAADGGTPWLTEFAGPADLSVFSGSLNPSLGQAYSSRCVPAPVSCSPAPAPAPTATGTDAGEDFAEGAVEDVFGGGDSASAAEGAVASGVDASDSGVGASPEAATSADAAGEAAAAPPPAPALLCTPAVMCDDLQIAMNGIAAGGLWITRMRSDLPSSALAADLVLEATASQEPVSNLHTTEIYTDPNYSPCPPANAAPRPSAAPSTAGPGGSGACACRTASDRPRYTDSMAASLALVGLSLAMRRRRRR